MIRRHFVRSALLTLLALVTAAPSVVYAQDEPVVVFLFRHAERAEDGTNDPPISEAGEARARLVAAMMEGARLTHIHSTDLKRTRSTAAPTAEATGLAVLMYDPGDLEGFAHELLATPGRHLVVGHSNTTPALVAALGGDPGPPIEEMEYDRAYVVVVVRGAAASSVIRYGS